jgi:hypothetical protein
MRAGLADGEFPPPEERRTQHVIPRAFRIRPVAADLLQSDGDEVAR